MRSILLLVFLAMAACGEQEESTPRVEQVEVTPSVVTFVGSGRNRACLTLGGKRMGFITYAANSNANCTVRGELNVADGRVPRFIVPDGDSSCRIRFSGRDAGRTLVLEEALGSCAYYCGPGARFDGAEFERNDAAPAAADLAGEPLC